MNSDFLANKVALITGASSGIGEATALVLARAGVRVALVARREAQLQDLQKVIAENGGDAAIFVADVGDEAQAFAAAEWAEKTFGAVDILVNNAGIIRPGNVATQSGQEWRDTFNINLLAPMYMSQAVLPGMKAQGAGHIVNISSNAAKIPGGLGQSSYAASKYGITAFSSALRKEVAVDGIRVTVIEPGTTATDVAQSIPDEQSRKFIDAHVHQETAMIPEDIAAAILYAVSQPERVNVNEIWLTPTR
jgi:NADP-dependent 3-hydroxy acid dehydrogenase YdfG